MKFIQYRIPLMLWHPQGYAVRCVKNSNIVKNMIMIFQSTESKFVWLNTQFVIVFYSIM